jgi:hypothetical protein
MNYGWTYNEDRILAATARLATASPVPSPLVGFWKSLQAKGVYYVSAQDSELKATGKWRDPNHQLRGTCVGQGSSRAIEDTHNARLASRRIVGKPVQITYEVMYGYERHEHYQSTQPWGTNGNCNDGLQGADAAAFYSVIGVLPRSQFDTFDLSQPCEKLAIEWNNSGVPPLLIAACGFHKISNHISGTWTEYADDISAECFGHVCLPRLFGYQAVIVGRYGTVEPDSSGGHDTECMGVVLLPDLTTGFQMQQSWGNGIKYPPVVQTAGGPLKMRPGSYVVRQQVLENMGSQVERISCDIPSWSSFR